MSLFNVALPKLPGPVRTALDSMIGHIARTIENTLVYNTDAVAFARGAIVSFYDNATTDVADVVRHSSDSTPDCKQQYCGVLEAAMGATADPDAPTVATSRHCGGPIDVLMDTGLDPHVGDSVWVTSDAPGGYGQLIDTVGENPPIYVGMIVGVGNYNPAAAAGTSTVKVLLKHAAPVIRGA